MTKSLLQTFDSHLIQTNLWSLNILGKGKKKIRVTSTISQAEKGQMQGYDLNREKIIMMCTKFRNRIAINYV